MERVIDADRIRQTRYCRVSPRGEQSQAGYIDQGQSGDWERARSVGGLGEGRVCLGTGRGQGQSGDWERARSVGTGRGQGQSGHWERAGSV